MSEQRPSHDALFRATFGRVDNAQGLLRHWLPKGLIALLRWESLRLEDPSGLDDELRPYYSDLLFSLCLKPAHRGVGNDPGEVLVYVLVEHQSTVDPLIAWRMQHYIGQAQRRCLADSRFKELPCFPHVPRAAGATL
ncbi:MAG: Rpn family recombination-promoting nuclease/putative transposase [Polyangiaceae bacterium]